MSAWGVVLSTVVVNLENAVAGQQIRARLVQKGLDQKSAAKVVADLTRMRSEAIRAAGKKDLLFGALWCVGGIVVTAVTYSAASGGGTYVVAWGAVIFGAIQFFRGLAQSSGG